MDALVIAAMAKWPQVPHCYGWLGLDQRGRWWMRDDAAQAAGPFAGDGASHASKGSELKHDKLLAFIGRNYACNAQGEWFFQNGPQRVYVELERTPWVWRVDAQGQVWTHTGKSAHIRAWASDEAGHVLGQSEHGWGVVHSQDVWIWAEQIQEPTRVQVKEVQAAQWLSQSGHCLSPQARASSSRSSLHRPGVR